LTFLAVAINAARTRIETAWRELNAKQQERDALIAALEALGPGDEGMSPFAVAIAVTASEYWLKLRRWSLCLSRVRGSAAMTRLCYNLQQR